MGICGGGLCRVCCGLESDGGKGWKGGAARIRASEDGCESCFQSCRVDAWEAQDDLGVGDDLCGLGGYVFGDELPELGSVGILQAFVVEKGKG